MTKSLTTRSATHFAGVPVEQLLQECEVRRTRRSGPGGQHRNKVETAVVITHRPTGVVAEASERRSQAENLSEAIFRLRVNLALETRSDRLSADAPSALWRSRCRDGKLAVNARHDDFPAILAEALDALASRQFDLRQAAEYLGCTSSQLTKLLAQEPRALARVNRERAQLGQHRLTA
ncbi:MAG: peptide chain release factor family protein [Planctomycetaceae bacterium]